MRRLKTVFMGTPDFSVPSLELLYNHPAIELCCVISQKDKPIGRSHSEFTSPEVIQFAKKNKILFFQTDNLNKDEAILDYLLRENIDLIIVLAFSQFLSQKILDIPTIGAFNIHTSLLPKYRGSAPIQYALLNGDSSTGVSIQKMVKKMDAGDICESSIIEISEDETAPQLYTRLKFKAALTLNSFVEKTLHNNLKFTKQDESLISFAPILKKEDGYLDFKHMDSKTIKNKIRALNPWPGTYINLNNKRLKVFRVQKHHLSLKPGEINIKHNELLIGCFDQTLRLLEVQLEGKTKVQDTFFLNGNKQDLILT